MRSNKHIISIVLLFVILSFSLAFAQQEKIQREPTTNVDREIKTRLQKIYDPATVETLSGTVESVESIVRVKGVSGGIHIQLKTDKEVIPVHLGPEWYIEKQNMKIEKGDKVNIKGSRVKLNDKPTIIAAEIKKGNNVLILRDSEGIPQWAGFRRR